MIKSWLMEEIAKLEPGEMINFFQRSPRDGKLYLCKVRMIDTPWPFPKETPEDDSQNK